MEFRSRQIILSMLIFGLTIILIFALSTDISREILTNYSPGMFWLMNLFIVPLQVIIPCVHIKDSPKGVHYKIPYIKSGGTDPSLPQKLERQRTDYKG